MPEVYRTWIEINEQALRNNLRALSSLLEPEAELCFVVKANAYGHGLKETVKIVSSEESVTYFAVDSLEEAREVKAVAPKHQILILGYTLHTNFEDLIKSGFEQTVYDTETVRKLQEVAAGLGKVAKIHLKIETGTHRQGVMTANLVDVCKEIKFCQNIELIGISTHFSNIEDTKDPSHAITQLKRYNEAAQKVHVVGLKPKRYHLAASGAIILFPESHGNMVRAGIAAYGLWPSDDVETTSRNISRHIDLNPVLSWKTRLAQIKDVPAGSPIGYGCTEIMPSRSRIAVIPVGYYDGFDRRLSNKGEVLIRGHRCKILGRICMNMCMVDISSLPQIKPEEEVVLIGQQGTGRITADDLAKIMETINYEVVARISPHLPRRTV